MQHTRRLLTGLLTLVPVARRITEGSPNELQSARYCYWVWLRHLKLARDSGLPTEFETVVEIGCGASLGVGLAALLTGSRRYYALAPEENLKVLDELVELFAARAPIPEGEYAPAILPRPRAGSPPTCSTTIAWRPEWPPVASRRFAEPCSTRAPTRTASRSSTSLPGLR